jgi:hypothetical protein
MIPERTDQAAIRKERGLAEVARVRHHATH